MTSEGMSQEKKVVAEVKLSLSEEKNLGFIESIAKTNTERFWKAYPKILVTVIVMMWTVEVKTPKIDHGDRAIQSSENQLLDKVTLRT
jgi:hypothetical protein